MTAPALRDPVGLLARSPELAALSERSPALRVAIERGRPHDAYRALFWAHKRGKLGDLAGVGEALLQHRRIFFKPLSGTPVMFTYNGIGTSLYGRGDPDPRDSTYVATLFAVFLFVPVFPLGSYLVRDAVSGKRRAWTFMAKVPLGARTYFWQRGVAVAMLLLIAFGAAHAFEGYGHNTLHIVSGLDRAVRVELASAVNAASARSEVLAPGGTVQIRAEVGKHALTIRDGDRVIESETVDVPRGRSALVWNVLGAAPVFVDRVAYVAEGKPAPELPRDEPELLCGKAFLARDGIDDVFTDSPKHISMPEHSFTVTRTHLGVAPGGLSTCVRYLAATGRVAEASRLSLKVARAERLPAAKLTPEVRALVTRAPLADAEAFAKGLLGWDDSIEAHRLYQNVLTENGLRARAISEYEARRAARPGDPDAEYLALRVRPHADERSAIDPLVASYPTHAFLRRIQIYVHYADGEYAQVVSASEALRELDGSLWRDGLDSHAEALVALGRGDEAMALAHEVASDASAPELERRLAELLEYRVAHRIGSPRPMLTPSGDDETSALDLRATTGEELSSAEIELVKDPDSKGALRVARAAQSSPGSAIELAREAGPRGMSKVPASVQILLLAEATRRADASALIPALASANLARHTLDAVLAYVAGGPPSDDLFELPLELRAAIEFGRSRAPGLSAKERGLALERAKSSDVLRGPVSVAIAGWPP